MSAVRLLKLFLSVLLPLSIAPPALAQSSGGNGFSAQISPLPILLSTPPGSSVGTDLRVNNPSSRPEKLKVLVKTFTQEGPNGRVVLHDPAASDTFISWIHFSKTEFDAPPGLWQTIHMNVDVPKTAAFGYYFAVEFTSASAPVSSGNTAKIQGAVASFVLLNATAPGEKKQLQVTSFSADHKSYEFLPVNFLIRLHNSGNIYAGASGNIFIMRGSKQVGVLTVNASHGLILPGSNRVFTAAWSDGFPVYKIVYDSNGQPVLNPDGSPKTKLSWDFSHANRLRFGHYTAKLALIYNDGNHDVPISGTVSFWVIPWRVLGGVLFFAIAIPLLAILWIRSRRKVRKLEKELHIRRSSKQ
jgi:hypothetical protein